MHIVGSIKCITRREDARERPAGSALRYVVYRNEGRYFPVAAFATEEAAINYANEHQLEFIIDTL